MLRTIADGWFIVNGGRHMNIAVDRSVWLPLPEDFNPDTTEFFDGMWHDGNGVVLAFNSIGFDRFLYPLLSDELEVRNYYRDLFAPDDIGLVECNVLEENGERFVKAIGKHTTDEGCSSYLGTLAIPLSDRSFVFSLHARELGLTGYRAATILDKLIREGHSIELDPVTRQIRGWAQDPYFPDYQGPCLRNLSEDEKFDHLFPEHPLTKVRFRINEIVDFVLS